MNVRAPGRLGVWLAISMILSGCAAVGEQPVEPRNVTGERMMGTGAEEATDAPQPPPPQAAALQGPVAYRFAAGDEVAISALRRPELSLTTRLDPYGYIAYPYLGQVRARGLTADELANRLTTQLQEGEFYTRPVITVGLVSSREQYVYVLGEVNRPGPVPVNGSVPMLSALGKAGGHTYDAEMRTVLWIRGSTTPPGVVQINLGQFGDPRQGDPRIPNLNMIAGDILFIPDSLIASVERAFIRFGNIISPLVELQRGLVLYPEVENFLSGNYDNNRNIIIAPIR